MNSQILYIKNMVCPRCIEAVQDILHDLNYGYELVELGKVVLNMELSQAEIKKLEVILQAKGFELLVDKNQKIIDEIKTEVIKIIHYSKDVDKHINISEHISKELGYDYSYLSSLFSSIIL